MCVNVAKETGTIVGFFESLTKLIKGYKTIKQLTETIREMQPDVAVLISFPGINLPLGKALRSSDIKVIYISPPQFWAWGRFRVNLLKQASDTVVCLFNFEQKLLQRAGIKAIYHGYPFYDAVKCQLSRNEVYRLLGLTEDRDYIVFLPGSRESEIVYHQPLFLQVFQHLKQKHPQLEGILIGGIEAELPAGMLRINPDIRYEVIAYARAALVVSGTATAELAILGVPMIVTYHLYPVSRFFARLFVKTPYFALPNIIANERIVNEYLEPGPALLSSALSRILSDNDYRQKIIDKLELVKNRLAPLGATEKIAYLILGIGELQ